MSVPFEDRLSDELQTAHARLGADRRSAPRRVIVPALGVLAAVLAAVLLVRDDAPVEHPSTIHHQALPPFVGVTARTPATPAQVTRMRDAVHLPVTHVVAIPAPEGAPHLPDRPAADWFIGTTKRRICFSDESGAACGNRSSFPRDGLVVVGTAEPSAFRIGATTVPNPAAAAGSQSLSRASGLLPRTFRSVRIIDGQGNVLAESDVANQAFSISVPDLATHARAVGTRADGTTTKLAGLGPVPTATPAATATPAPTLSAGQQAGARRAEQRAAALLPVFARPRTAADALPPDILRQVAMDGPRTDPGRSRRVPGSQPVWLLPATSGDSLVLVRPGFTGETPLGILRSQGFSPGYAFNHDTPPIVEGVALDTVKSVTVITADGTPVVVRNRQNFIHWQDPKQYPNGIKQAQMPRAVRWREPDGHRHVVRFR